MSVLKSPATSPLVKASLGGFIISEVPQSDLKSLQHPSEMTVRFRFSLALFLAFLLTSPTRAFIDEKSYTATAQAWNGVKDKISLGKDSQFVYKFADCLNGAKKTCSEIQGIINVLPEVIDKVLLVGRTQGLALLSMYFFYKSYLLYDEAKILEANVKIYRDKFEALEKDIKPLKDFINTELIPQWEAGNTANLEKTVDKLLAKMGRYAPGVQELTQAIRQDINTGRSNQRRSIFVAVGGLLACVGSFIAGTPPICAVTIGTTGYSWLSYSSVSDILPKLERLEKAATNLSQEITRYQLALDLAKMRDELYIH